jgi:hypothetical protein
LGRRATAKKKYLYKSTNFESHKSPTSLKNGALFVTATTLHVSANYGIEE